MNVNNEYKEIQHCPMWMQQYLKVLNGGERGQLVDFGKNVGVCNFSIWLKESSIDTGVYTSWDDL